MKIELIKDLQEKGFGEKQAAGAFRFYYPSIKEIIDILSEKRISFSINEDIPTYYDEKIKKGEIVVIESDGVQSVMSEFGPIEFGVHVYSLSTGIRANSIPQSKLVSRINELFDSIDNMDSLRQKAVEWENNSRNTFYSNSSEHNVSFDVEGNEPGINVFSIDEVDEKKFKLLGKRFAKTIINGLIHLENEKIRMKKTRKIKNKMENFIELGK